jgi:hypothetical protein
MIDVSWTVKGNHVLKIVAHAAPPMSPTPGFRQYEFLVDGLSFFRFPKIARIGVQQANGNAAVSPTNSNTRGSSEGGQRYRVASVEAPTNPDEVRCSVCVVFVC